MHNLISSSRLFMRPADQFLAIVWARSEGEEKAEKDKWGNEWRGDGMRDKERWWKWMAQQGEPPRRNQRMWSGTTAKRKGKFLKHFRKSKRER